jgi:hypothetical protein
MPVGRPKKRSRIAVRNSKTGQIAPGNNEDLSFDEHQISGRSDVVVEDVMSDDEDESVSASLQGSQLNCCWADAAEPLFPAQFLDVSLQEHASGHQHPAGHGRKQGLSKNKKHDRFTCENKATGHKESATVNNKMGGSEKVYTAADTKRPRAAGV